MKKPYVLLDPILLDCGKILIIIMSSMILYPVCIQVSIIASGKLKKCTFVGAGLTDYLATTIDLAIRDFRASYKKYQHVIEPTISECHGLVVAKTIGTCFTKVFNRYPCSHVYFVSFTLYAISPQIKSTLNNFH